MSNSVPKPFKIVPAVPKKDFLKFFEGNCYIMGNSDCKVEGLLLRRLSAVVKGELDNTAGKMIWGQIDLFFNGFG